MFRVRFLRSPVCLLLVLFPALLCSGQKEDPPLVAMFAQGLKPLPYSLSNSTLTGENYRAYIRTVMLLLMEEV